jgi:hypothetical protein
MSAAGIISGFTSFSAPYSAPPPRLDSQSRSVITPCVTASPRTCSQPATTSSDVKTTMIYTHVLGLGASGVRSPLDGLEEAERYAADSVRNAAREPCR